MMLIILANLVLVVYQTDIEATCFPEFTEKTIADCPSNGNNIEWLRLGNLLLLILYSFEAMGKVFVAHCSYFRHVDNLVDFTICVLGWVSEVLTGFISLSWMRVFRLWRMLLIGIIAGI